MTAPIELYYWPTPNGWKISIALHEMELPYNLNLVNIGKGDQFEPEFLRSRPTTGCRRSSIPRGRTARPISVFESGAILQYLGRKTGRFYGATERERVEIEQWLFWQMGGVGPMAGQAHHFLHYAPRWTRRTICPMPRTATATRSAGSTACWTGGWRTGTSWRATTPSPTWRSGPGRSRWENQSRTSTRFPHMEAWLERVGARPAVQAGGAVGERQARAILATGPRRRRGSCSAQTAPRGLSA